jgi:hypothetical protein
MATQNPIVAFPRRALLAAAGFGALCWSGLGAFARSSGRIFVTRRTPLKLEGDAALGHVVLEGGQIQIKDGSRVRIDRLTKG